ncbi:MAG TPA: helix-turn-helix transcriptional regulator [Kofleriaceae bacterium]|nr:helix-turn-helix transcriptional regulator [Kofleriaceae bacterium]
MNPFGTILSIIESLFPDIKTAVTGPKQDDGVWSLEVDLADNSISVDWERGVGFGISTVRAESYGERPDEMYPDAITALARLITLLGLKQQTAPQTPIMLSELRERRSYTQAALAGKLKIRQPTLSAIEHREDVQVGTIRSFVEALGGKLELLAVFDDVCYVVDTKLARRRSKAIAVPPIKRWFTSLSVAPPDDEARDEEEGVPLTLSYAIPL